MEFGLGEEKKINDMEECDPMFECSLKFKFLISTVFISYPETLKDLRQKAKQTRLMHFFKTVWEEKSRTPSTNHKSQAPQAELPDVSMPPSLIPSSSINPSLVLMGEGSVNRFNPTVAPLPHHTP